MWATTRQPEVKLIDAIVAIHHLTGMFGDAGIQAIKHGHNAGQVSVGEGNVHLFTRFKGDKDILIALALPREMYRLRLLALNVQRCAGVLIIGREITAACAAQKRDLKWLLRSGTQDKGHVGQ